MYEELPDELERHFGPGLLKLADLSAPALAPTESTAERSA